VLRDLPGREKGLQFQFQVHVGGEGFAVPFEIENTAEVWWKKWSDPSNPDRWIAVAFVWMGDGGIASTPRVIAIRKNEF
jgi:hypothetical protein